MGVVLKVFTGCGVVLDVVPIVSDDFIDFWRRSSKSSGENWSSTIDSGVIGTEAFSMFDRSDMSTNGCGTIASDFHLLNMSIDGFIDILQIGIGSGKLLASPMAIPLLVLGGW